MGIKLLVADDHSVVREGVKSLVRRAGDIEVVAEAGDGKDAVQKALSSSPDVVLMDLHMPLMTGIVATQHIVSQRPAIGVLMLSTCRDKSCIMAALKAGALGYLGKDCRPDELLEGIRSIAKGRSYFCQVIKELLLKDYAKRLSEDGGEGAASLSEKEHQVLQQIAGGKSIKETAFMLGISVKTVETHRRRIMQKLGAQNTAELVRFAVREGLVSTW